VPITYNTSDDSTNVVVMVNHTQFSISLAEIAELNPNGITKVRSLNLSEVNFELTFSNTSLYDLWNYSAILNATTALEIYILYFPNATTVEFLGQGSYAPSNSFKIALALSDWPFQSVQNTLQFLFENLAPDQAGEITKCDVNSHSDNGDSLRWYQLNVNGYALYAQMEENAYLDGRSRRITFTNPKPTTIAVNVPFFWHNLTLDPNFAVLVNDDPSALASACSGPLQIDGSNWEVYLAIPVGVVLLVLVVFIWKYLSVRDCIRAKGKHAVEVDMDES